MQSLSKFQLWIAGLSLFALLVVLIAPQTGWVLRYDVNPFIPAPDSTEFNARVHAYAMRHPKDYPLQLAVTEEDVAKDPASQQRDFAELERRFANNPSTYANAMGVEDSDAVEIEWRARESVQLGGNPKFDTADLPMPTVETQALLNEVIRQGQMAEAIDPNNAFFPLMIAEDYFSLHEESLAIACIEKAGRETDWNEYGWDEESGGWSAYKAVDGGVSGIDFYSAPLSSPTNYGAMRFRSLTRMAVWEAQQDELSGNTAQGLMLRESLMRCGALMRYRSHRYGTNLVAVALIQGASGRPGGVRHRIKLNRNQAQLQQFAILRHQQIAFYLAYLTAHKKDAEAAWVKKEEAAGDAMEAATRFGSFQGPDAVSVILDCVYQFAASIALCWLLMALILCALSLAINPSCVLESRSKLDLFVRLAATIVLAASGAALVRALVHARSIAGFADSINIEVIPDGCEWLVILILTSLPLILLLVFLSIDVFLRKKNLHTFLLDSTVKGAIPILCVSILLYCGFVVLQAGQDRVLSQNWNSRVRIGGGQFLAQQYGNSWPGPVPEPSLAEAK